MSDGEPGRMAKQRKSPALVNEGTHGPCRVAISFTGPPIKLRASALKGWVSCQLGPSVDRLFGQPKCFQSFCLFSKSQSLGLKGRPGLRGILSRFLRPFEPRFSFIAFLRMVRQRCLLASLSCCRIDICFSQGWPERPTSPR
jgi:hypothetical protein